VGELKYVVCILPFDMMPYGAVSTRTPFNGIPNLNVKDEEVYEKKLFYEKEYLMHLSDPGLELGNGSLKLNPNYINFNGFKMLLYHQIALYTLKFTVVVYNSCER
jgi:hypothetical protein